MTNLKKTLLATTVGVLAFSSAAMADKTLIRTETVVSPQKVENANYIELREFDQNDDGVLTMAEVGEKLFFIFDRDGNEVIDNIEFDTNSLMTVTPMEKETLTLVDHRIDGTVEHTTYTYETFLQESRLIQFADDHNGLSPREFVDTSFLIMDDNDDKTIDMEEWKEAYIEMVMPKSAEQERYNN